MPPVPVHHVRRVDPRDDAAFEAWFDVRLRGQQHDEPGTDHGTLTEQRALHREWLAPDAPVQVVLLAAVEGARTVGVARLELPQRDNPHRVDLELRVDLDRRRRGVGSALLAEAVRVARDRGRTTVFAEVGEPLGAVAGRGFAGRHGAVCGQVDARRELALPVDPDRLAALDTDARAHAAGYTVVTWQDAVPDGWLEDRALLEQRMSTDAPLGDLDLREEHWDAARVRRHEQVQHRAGRTVVAAGAVRDGRLVAFTEIGVLRDRPEVAHQWNTLVLREHRGKRLGMLVKIAGLRALAAHVPQAERVVTWNAEVNAPMIGVNAALGFVVAGGSSTWSLAV